MMRRSRKGAWIEIDVYPYDRVIIVRSRKGAWIEILAMQDDLVNMQVAPVRERGLKFYCEQSPRVWEQSLP